MPGTPRGWGGAGGCLAPATQGEDGLIRDLFRLLGDQIIHLLVTGECRESAPAKAAEGFTPALQPGHSCHGQGKHALPGEVRLPRGWGHLPLENRTPTASWREPLSCVLTALPCRRGLLYCIGFLGKKIFPVKMLRPWHTLPRETLAAPFLQVSQTRMDGAWRNLIYWKVSLPVAGRWGWMVCGSFQSHSGIQ